MKFNIPERPSEASLDDTYYLDYLQRLYNHIKGDDDWIAPTLLNGWVRFDVNNPNAGYRLKNGIVYIQGLIKSGTTTSGTVLFTLPEGYRPLLPLIKPTVVSGNVFGSMTIEEDGDVTFRSGNNAWFSLQCSFIAEQ